MIRLIKYEWYNVGDIWVTGHIRLGDKFLREEGLLNFFSEADTFSKFETTLKSANGQFSVVIKSPEGLWAASDRLRNYPLFYTKVDSQYIISDDCYSLAAMQSETKFNSDAVISFLASGYVLNNLTLINNVYQVEAGGWAFLGNSEKTGYYHDSSLEKTAEKDFDSGVTELENLIVDLFGSYFRSLNDRFIAIPLSGGYDSRLIAAMCAKFHPENVLCYTYGTKNNPEVEPAKKAAEHLGLKWVNIIYDKELINGFLTEKVFKEYYPYVSELSSMFFLQEYFAVKYLKENNLIPADSVFIPGFTGDVLAGSHLFPAMNILIDGDLRARLVFKEYLRLITLDSISKSSLINLIRSKTTPERLPAWKTIESFDMKERQAKFVVNSAKVYKYFGYDYVLPFWDNQLGDFFSSVPFHLKLNKKLYDHVLKEKIFKDINLNFEDEINPSPLQKLWQRIKENIKTVMPYNLKKAFIKGGSPILYDEITKQMLNEFGQNPVIVPWQPNYYNSYITQWYLLKTRELFSIK